MGNDLNRLSFNYLTGCVQRRVFVRRITETHVVAQPWYKLSLEHKSFNSPTPTLKYPATTKQTFVESRSCLFVKSRWKNWKLFLKWNLRRFWLEIFSILHMDILRKQIATLPTNCGLFLLMIFCNDITRQLMVCSSIYFHGTLVI